MEAKGVWGPDSEADDLRKTLEVCVDQVARVGEFQSLMKVQEDFSVSESEEYEHM